MLASCNVLPRPNPVIVLEKQLRREERGGIAYFSPKGGESYVRPC